MIKCDVAGLAFGVFASAALTACGDGPTTSALDAGDDRADAIGVDHAEPDVDAASDDAHADASIDGTADGGCACFPFDNDAGIAQAVITTSLECFSINARWMYDYSAYAADRCIGRPPYRREDIYGDTNLIGVWSTDSVNQEALYGYFYDTASKELVGAMREAPWLGDDPASCSPTGPHGAGRYNRLRAGIVPDCNSTGWISCSVISTRMVSCPPDAGAGDADAMDAGARDAAEDVAIDGAVDVGEGGSDEGGDALSDLQGDVVDG